MTHICCCLFSLRQCGKRKETKILNSKIDSLNKYSSKIMVANLLVRESLSKWELCALGTICG
jgi:hypothetical protein